MKTKLLLIGLTSLLFGNANGQLLNGGFEDTLIIPSQFFTGQFDTVPENWFLAYPKAGAKITNDAFSGINAVLLWSWYYGQSNGELVYGNNYFFRGLPISYRPEKLIGQYKFNLVSPLDSALVEVYLFRYNSLLNQRDTVGFGKSHLGDQTVYASFETPIQYFSSLMPDTVSIYFRSSVNQWMNCNSDGNGNCNYLYLDELALPDPAGIKYLTQENLLIYPNPSNGIFSISINEKKFNVTIYDVTGKAVYECKNEKQINISDKAKGIYFIKITSEDKTYSKKIIIQ